MSTRRTRSRRGAFIAVIVLAAVVAGASIGLSHLNSAGETATPVLAEPATLTPSVKPVPAVAASPDVLASPTSTPYPAPLAQAVVQRYWDFISRGEVSRAYDLLSTGAQAATSRQSFIQSITHLLDTTNGLTAVAGTASVHGDTASVPVTLHFTNGAAPTQNTQQLVWEDPTWRIDESSGATPSPTPGA